VTRRLPLLCALLFAPLAAGHHVGDPVPRSALGPMRGDDGRLMKSPFALEAGRVELSLTAVSYAHDLINPARDGVNIDRLTFLEARARLGLLDGVELALAAPGGVYTRIETSDLRALVNHLGPGPVEISVRFGTPGERFDPLFAMAAIPWVRLPVSPAIASGAPWEAGIRIPLEWKIEQNLLDLQLGYVASVLQAPRSLTNTLEAGLGISRRAREALFLATGLHAQFDVEDLSRWRLFAELGVSWAFHPYWRAWAELRLGLSLPSEDAAITAGLALRL